MRAKIVGDKKVDFTNQEGRQIKGLRLYYEMPIPPDQGEGVETDNFFLSAEKLAKLDFTPQPNQIVEIYYDRRGRVETMKYIEDDDFGDITLNT